MKIMRRKMNFKITKITRNMKENSYSSKMEDRTGKFTNTNNSAA
jgi:hypothetical protein